MTDGESNKDLGLERRAEELYGYIDQLMYRNLVVQSDCLDTQWGTLSHQEEKVIKVLGEQEPCIMRQIADHLGFALSTATGVVDRLVEKDLVRRERSDEDRRVVRVRLTEGGREAFRIQREKFMELYTGMLMSLSDKEQELLLSLIRKTIRAGSDR